MDSLTHPAQSLARSRSTANRSTMLTSMAIAAALVAAPNGLGQSTELVSIFTNWFTSGGSFARSISADGRYVAFESFADDIVPGDTNGTWDVFVHDRQTGQTERVSVSSDGQQTHASSRSPSISADGRFVAFQFFCDGFIAQPVSTTSGSDVPFQFFRAGGISCNLVPDDVVGSHIAVHDRQTGQTKLVSVSSDGEPANDSSSSASISADGRFVAFASSADNLVPDDTNEAQDVFVRDRQTGQTERVSISSEDQ